MARKATRTDDYAQQVEVLLASTWAFDNGPAKVALLEEAVRLADAHNDDELGFRARLELITAATFGGAPDVAMVAFAWCVARADAEPERFAMHRLLWMYKWVLDAAPDYPTIGRAQITDMLADMQRRYRAAGAGLHPVHQVAREVFRVMGDMKAAKAAHTRVLRLRREALSNCPACEQHAQVKFYLETGRTAQAFKKAEPLVSGRMGCAEVPHTTYSHLLLPLLRAGDPETAAEYHRKGTTMIRTNRKFVPEASRHLVYLVVANEWGAAAKYFERHAGNGVTTTCPAWRYEFARAATLLFDRLAERPRPPRVRLPAGLPLPEGVDGTDLAGLRDHFGGVARELAEVFDDRNCNDRFRRRLAELADLKEGVAPRKGRGKSARTTSVPDAASDGPTPDHTIG
jgi:hypothetical protein